MLIQIPLRTSFILGEIKEVVVLFKFAGTRSKRSFNRNSAGSTISRSIRTKRCCHHEFTQAIFLKTGSLKLEYANRLNSTTA